MNKVVLLDRDGTVILEPSDERVTDESKIKLFPDTIPALKKLADAGYSIILITNQDTIPEGLITQEEFWRLNQVICSKISESGIKVLKTYMCPHALSDNCECRKPKPKMLLDAIKEFDLDPSDTFMVGDRLTDVQAGKSAGVKTIHINSDQNGSKYADYEAKNLTQAIDYIIKIPE